MTLAEVMHVHLPTLSPESTFRDAVDKMDVYQFPALVIVNADHAPVAVVTEGDLVRAVTLKGDATGLASLRVLDFATSEPIVSEPGVEIGEALHLMISRGLTILPIASNGRFLGVVLRTDLMQALLMDAATPLSGD